MNKKYLLAILVSLLINLTYSQNHYNGRIIYNAYTDFKNLKTSLKDTSNFNKKKKIISSLITTSKVVEYELLFTFEKSLFKIVKKVESEYDRGINLTKILAGKGVYFKNIITKESIKQEDAFSELFIIKLYPLNWNLSQESKRIGKYLCYKATTTIKVEGSWGKADKIIIAWYAPKIPISFGPKNYNGLPGLILELEEGKLIFKAIKIDLNSKENIIIKKPTKGKIVTEEEFNNIAKKMVRQRRVDRRNR